MKRYAGILAALPAAHACAMSAAASVEPELGDRLGQYVDTALIVMGAAAALILIIGIVTVIRRK